MLRFMFWELSGHLTHRYRIQVCFTKSISKFMSRLNKCKTRKRLICDRRGSLLASLFWYPLFMKFLNWTYWVVPRWCVTTNNFTMFRCVRTSWNSLEWHVSAKSLASEWKRIYSKAATNQPNWLAASSTGFFLRAKDLTVATSSPRSWPVF